MKLVYKPNKIGEGSFRSSFLRALFGKTLISMEDIVPNNNDAVSNTASKESDSDETKYIDLKLQYWDYKLFNMNFALMFMRSFKENNSLTKSKVNTIIAYEAYPLLRLIDNSLKKMKLNSFEDVIHIQCKTKDLAQHLNIGDDEKRLTTNRLFIIRVLDALNAFEYGSSTDKKHILQSKHDFKNVKLSIPTNFGEFASEYLRKIKNGMCIKLYSHTLKILNQLRVSDRVYAVFIEKYYCAIRNSLWDKERRDRFDIATKDLDTYKLRKSIYELLSIDPKRSHTNVNEIFRDAEEYLSCEKTKSMKLKVVVTDDDINTLALASIPQPKTQEENTKDLKETVVMPIQIAQPLQQTKTPRYSTAQITVGTAQLPNSFAEGFNAQAPKQSLIYIGGNIQ